MSLSEDIPLQEQHTAQLVPDEVEKVVEEALQIEAKFVSVLTHTKMEFSKKPPKFLNELRTTLITLPVSSMFKHLQFLKSERERIMNARSVNEIFIILDEYWDYTNYALLQYLIQKFGKSSLKKKMRDYVAALEDFEKRTTIQDSDSAVSINRRRKRPITDGYEFSTVDIKQQSDPEVYTLYEARQLEESITKRACLMPYIMRRKKATCHSVVISLVFPCDALELIIAALTKEFLDAHQIISTTIDRKPLEGYNKKYMKVGVTR